MELLVLLIVMAPLLSSGLCNNPEEIVTNSTDPNKDMYIIHAMVYQVGIMTNKTDDANNFTGGNQEAVTFYHKNGSHMDLNSIPAPLITNVTAQSMVGVAPVPQNQGQPMSWTELEDLASLKHLDADTKSKVKEIRNIRRTDDKDYQDSDETVEHRSLDDRIIQAVFKRQENDTPVEIVNGSAMIPQKAGVQSLVIPPLLSFNNNMSDIPIPIPNTSIVHYAKVNTLVEQP